MASPLFKVASSAVRAAAVRDFSRSRFGRLMTEVKRGKQNPKRLNEIVRRYGRHFDPQKMIREAMGSDLRQVVRQVELYTRRGGVSRRLLDEFLDALGPTSGNLIRALAGVGKGRGPSKALEQSMAAATRLLESQGGVVIQPGTGMTVGQAGRGVEGLINYLESIGHKVIRKEDQPQPMTQRGGLPAGVRGENITGDPGRGRLAKLPPDHPAVSGDFVNVSGSENVHSYAYDADAEYLYVRFLASQAGGEKTSSPGSLYRYRNINPQMFLDLHVANSKGSWVWDNLRIRGTVSGYQKPYALVGVMNGYVPRQATYVGKGQEWFLRRQLHAGGGRYLISDLPNEPVPPGIYRGRTNTGRPTRPNNGRGNTGRP